MKIYNDIMRQIMKDGVDRKGRSDAVTRALFGLQMRFNMQDGFPAVTTKKLAFNKVKGELLWFLNMKGQERASDEHLKAIDGSEKTIWTANAEADYWKQKSKFKGDLGRVYGIQWFNWRGQNGKVIDQFGDVIKMIKTDPSNRRLIVTAWNPAELDEMALPPCHMFMQFFVADGKLSLFMHQRSCDMFLGVPFNIASYALLLHMVAQVTGLEAHEFIHSLGDAHIYHEHFDAVDTQLSRPTLPLPTLVLNPAITDISAFKMDDIILENYISHAKIDAKMIV